MVKRKFSGFASRRSPVRFRYAPSRALGRRLLPAGRDRPAEPPDAAGGTILSEPVYSHCSLRARTASSVPKAREASVRSRYAPYRLCLLEVSGGSDASTRTEVIHVSRVLPCL